MEQFNKNTLQSYFDNRDYNGALTYLSQLTPKEESRLEYYNKIQELKRLAEIQNAQLQKLDSNTQEAYHFIKAIDGQGNIPENNYYGDFYREIMNDLKVTEDTYSPGKRNLNNEFLSSIRIKLKDENAYREYLGHLGIDEKDFKAKQITFGRDSNTGEYILGISASNRYAYQLYDAAKKLDKMQVGPKDVDSGYSVSDMYDLSSTKTFLESLGIAALMLSGPQGRYYHLNESQYSIEAKTESNVWVKESQTNLRDLASINNNVKFARNKVNSALDDMETTTVVEDMAVSPFLGQGQAEAYNMMAKGLIDRDEYNKIVKERTEVYNTLLKGSDFNNFQIYALDEEDLEDEKAAVLKEVSAKDKTKLYEQVVVAMNDGRITYSAAIHGGEAGTYITIDPKTDKNDNLSEGDYGKRQRIFIPGLFKSSVDEAFNADSKTRAVRNYTDVQRWNYEKKLHRNMSIGHDKELGDYKIDKEGNKIQISKQEMLQLLNRENIIDDAIQLGLSNIKAENGENIEYTDIKNFMYNLDSSLSDAVNELYPNYDEDSKIVEKASLWSDIITTLQSYYK